MSCLSIHYCTALLLHLWLELYRVNYLDADNLIAFNEVIESVCSLEYVAKYSVVAIECVQSSRGVERVKLQCEQLLYA
jgi:hypothetical protein